MTAAPCGTHTKYQRGCRCRPCKDANAETMRDYRKRKAEGKVRPYKIGPRPLLESSTMPFNRNNWRAEAACAGMDSSIFFVSRGTPPTEALKICGTCPVTEECAEFAASYDKPVISSGVWGGLTTSGIRKLRQDLQAVS